MGETNEKLTLASIACAARHTWYGVLRGEFSVSEFCDHTFAEVRLLKRTESDAL